MEITNRRQNDDAREAIQYDHDPVSERLCASAQTLIHSLAAGPACCAGWAAFSPGQLALELAALMQ